MLTAEQQETLTRVGRGTPMGELLRRYWFPVVGSAELARGAALPVRLLGEDLALFRTAGGEVGLLDARCPHRGASLAYGIADASTVRCPYHGWRFDAGGACVSTSALTGEADAGVRARARVPAYLAQDLGGLVFAYLGPPPAPLLPRYDLFVWDGVLRDIGRALLPCNWLQIMENSVDPTHLEWLHGQHLAAMRGAAGRAAPTRYARAHAEIGFDVVDYGIIKRRVLVGGSRMDEDWRVGHPLVFPCMVRVGAQRQHVMQIRVPVDDTQTLHFWYCVYRPTPGVSLPPQGPVPLYDVPFRDERGRFVLDFVDGGDIMTWVTQGAIADRTREILVDSDRGIVLFRRLLFEQIERVRAGLDPLGTIRSAAENAIIALPQESEKYGDGGAFLAEVLPVNQMRYSPLRARILEVLGLAE